MKQPPPDLKNNNIDDHVDHQINTCLSLEKPVSFFLFAGAGSGKTRSLVSALKFSQQHHGKYLRLRNQKIGVITYTNAACDEIKKRIDFDSLIMVKTIHSFIWELIKSFHHDIKKWLLQNLQEEINELNEKQTKGRSGTKTAIDRENSIRSKEKRLQQLSEIKEFTYNPNGNNLEKNSLNHSEIIKLGAYFLTEKPLMQNILICKFPIILIDESQDTNKLLLDAFFKIQAKFQDKFILGLFGDSMQQIYTDGKTNLGKDLPANWATPTKEMNHRCPARIVTLINKIRSVTDNQIQKSRSNKESGFVRLYILPNNTIDKQKAEQAISKEMAKVTNDPLWITERPITLILEHHMAAKRLGFAEMFEPLYGIDKFKTGLLDGTLPFIRLFSKQVLPLIKAIENEDNFTITAIIRQHSPLLSKQSLKTAGNDQTIQLKKARNAIQKLKNIYFVNNNLTFLEILYSIHETNLFEIPDSLQPIINRTSEQQKSATTDINKNELTKQYKDTELDALDKFLLTSFSQIKSYSSYINHEANIDTHQGIKGREFPRVMAIIDDSEARGFLFSYEKLFGAKEKTKTDIDNENTGDDTSISRTRRLFYVICSRAEKSLAIVAYSENPQKVSAHVIEQGWFESTEVGVSVEVCK